MSVYRGFMKRFFDGVWNQGNDKLIDELVAPDCQIHGLGEKMSGSAPFKAFHKAFSATFSDIHVSVDDELIDGDRIAVRCTFRGKHRQGGQAVAIMGGGICRVSGSRLVEAWNVWDFLGLLQQTGHVPGDAFNHLVAG